MKLLFSSLPSLIRFYKPVMHFNLEMASKIEWSAFALMNF